ncbi:ParB N-terminal domain-containing protein [Enterobacter cloacae]
MEYSQQLKPLLQELDRLLDGTGTQEKVAILNELSAAMLVRSPFTSEPLAHVRWLNASLIEPNTYNPNNIAPPEIRLLTRSILSEGFTQPLIVRQTSANGYVLIDGHHRHNIILNNQELHRRLYGFVPVVVLREPRDDTEDMAASIRHNRARGRYQVQGMSSLVTELHRLGWSEKQIATELGMESDEVLRLRQLDGLGELFRHRSYSRAWTIGE